MSRILFYLSGLQKGGTERVVVNLAEYFAGKGYEVTIATTHVGAEEFAYSEMIHRIITEPTEEELTNSRLHNFWIRYRKLRKSFLECQPDLIVSFIGKNNMMAILATLFTRIPVLVAVRGEPRAEYYNRLLRFISKTLFGLAEGVILQTTQSKNYFPVGIRKKTVVLRNPIHPMYITDTYAGERENTIVSVGRVDENKNQKLLIDAFSGLAKEFPEWKVVIYGEGDQRKSLQRYVEEQGLEHQIQLPGATENTREAIYRAGIFVLTSNTEGMPNALIEAMVLGLPVISTDCPCGGPAELIRTGENGVLIPVGDIGKLEEELRSLLSNQKKRASLGKQAEKVQELLEPAKVNKEWEMYFEHFMR